MGNENSVHLKLKRVKTTGILTLSDLGLTKLSHKVETAELKDLKVLDLSFNKLEFIPDCLKKCHSIKYVNMSKNGLLKIDSWVFDEWRLLEHFSISFNVQLTSLPPQIAHWTLLTTLDASHCSFEEIPEQLGSCKALVSLNLSRNKIKNIPRSMAKLVKLELLDLSFNQLITLEPESVIASMKSLKQLKLESNAIAEFPNSILAETPVTLVTLDNNLLSMDKFMELDSYPKYEERRKQRSDQLLKP